LERLCKKLGVRLGADDELCLQLKQELDALRSSVRPEALPQDWSVSYRSFLKNCVQKADAEQLEESLM
jgi:hypothetical protein